MSEYHLGLFHHYDHIIIPSCIIFYTASCYLIEYFLWSEYENNEEI